MSISWRIYGVSVCLRLSLQVKPQSIELKRALRQICVDTCTFIHTKPVRRHMRHTTHVCEFYSSSRIHNNNWVIQLSWRCQISVISISIETYPNWHANEALPLADAAIAIVLLLGYAQEIVGRMRATGDENKNQNLNLHRARTTSLIYNINCWPFYVSCWQDHRAQYSITLK